MIAILADLLVSQSFHASRDFLNEAYVQIMFVVVFELSSKLT